ncbi:TD and POZ domain-containing protein 3-like [Argiope bruennichi]|uniref:TD and POZ domain-containing protein 3-like n=1 Tax=Argiope bruennichi TaxID=94029 RepID=UPI00249414D1|nr:TD and POZ domain-containing protein 3-like [Argiope bruennichi]
MNDTKKQCIFTWLIENYSHCWHKNGEALVSPEFTAEWLEGSIWTIQLYPRGNKDKDQGIISIFLNRKEDDNGPKDFSLNFELLIVAADDSFVSLKGNNRTFKRGNGFGNAHIIQRDEVLLLRNPEYLPNDTLTVRCKIWKEEVKINEKVTLISARTRIGIEHVSFLHVVGGFSALTPNQRRTVQIRSPTKENCAISSSVHFIDDSCGEGKIIVAINSSGTVQILSKCKVSLLDVFGKYIQGFAVDHQFYNKRRDIKNMPLSLTRKAILHRKIEYLPNDTLSLLCECVFSCGTEYKNIERSSYEIPSMTLNQINANYQHNERGNISDTLSVFSSALDDFQTFYNSQLLTDVVLKTKTKSFPAHKLVLCARSPVFKAILTNDMKEKTTNCIEVDDLENDTVDQLLMFLYSDQIKNLQWESVTKLYYAADKYEVEKLKIICAVLLEEKLSIHTASALLLLADAHNDADLKKAVEDFILDHDELVFGSEEWEDLMKTNPLLVSETMRLKYKRQI